MININSLKLREVFETMSYPEATEDFSCANDWLHTMNDIMDIVGPKKLENTMVNVSKEDNHFSSKEKISFLLSLSKSVEKNSKTICQIDAKSRGILMRDTQSQALPFLCDSLVYYSSLASENNDFESFVLYMLCDDIFLGLLGPLIGAAVAGGHRIVIQANSEVFPVVRFIIKLAEELECCPEHMFTFVSGDLWLSRDPYTTIVVVDNFFRNEYSQLKAQCCKNFVAMDTSLRAPMVVFSDADLDSACETVIEAAWSYGSLLPWSVNQLIVQESVFERFLGKLKRRLSKVKAGTADQKSIDIAIPKYADKVNEVVAQAKKMGLEVYQNDPDSNTFQPSLIIGGKVFSNRVTSENSYAPVVQVLTFRSVDEGVALANNSRQGLAASVWTQNIDTAEEVAAKLMVTNIWINTYGNFTSMAPINFRKRSGIGYFGGRQGYMEYLGKNISIPLKQGNVINNKSTIDLAGLVNDLKSCGESWKKLNLLDRYKILSSSNIILPDYLAKQFSNILSNSCIFASNQGNYSVRCIKEARGVIMIFYPDTKCQNVEELILSSLLLGNSLIIVKPKGINPSHEISWPTNVPVKTHVVDKSYHKSILIEAVEHKGIDSVGITDNLNPVIVCPLLDPKKIFTIQKDWESTCAQSLYVIKNIWSTKQQTF